MICNGSLVSKKIKKYNEDNAYKKRGLIIKLFIMLLVALSMNISTIFAADNILDGYKAGNGAVATAHVRRSWYYAYDNSANSGTYTLNFTLEGPTNPDINSKQVKIAVPIPANVLRIFIWDVFTGGSSREIGILGFVDFTVSGNTITHKSHGSIAMVGMRDKSGSCTLGRYRPYNKNAKGYESKHNFFLPKNSKSGVLATVNSNKSSVTLNKWVEYFYTHFSAKVFDQYSSADDYTVPNKSDCLIRWQDAFAGSSYGIYCQCANQNNFYYSTITPYYVDPAGTFSGTYHQYGKVIVETATQPITIPSLIASSFVYDGSAHTAMAEGTGYTLTNNVKTNAGSYTITATLQSGYIWSDNTTADKTFNWSITPKKIDVTWGTRSFEVDGQNHIPVATANSGVTGETINLSVVTAQKLLGGPYNATASITSVTGGNALTSNYTLLNNTTTFSLVDTINPSLTVTSSNTNWTNQDVTLTFSATDKYENGSKSGSGVKAIQESADGTTFGTNIATDTNVNHVDLSSSKAYTTGNNTFLVKDYYFRAVDRANRNSETVKQTIMIDKIKPSITVTATPNTTNWSSQSRSFSITVQDVNSGLNKIQYSKNEGGNWTDLKTGLQGATEQQNYLHTESQEQNGKIRFRVYDIAGNYTDTTDFIVKIDKSLPTIAVTRTITAGGEDDWTNGKVTFRIVCTDSQAGIKAIQYKRDLDADWVNIRTYANPGTLNATVTQEFNTEQNSEVQFRVSDWIETGEMSYAYSTKYAVKIDKTAPTLTVTHDTTWTNQDVIINMDAKDNLAGVSTTAGKFTWNSRNVTDFTIINKEGTSKTNIIGKIAQPINITNGVASIKDRAGNSATVNHTVTNIDKIAPTITLNSTSNTRYQTFTIADAAATTQYGQSLLYGFAGVDSESIVPIRDNEGENWVGTLRNEVWYRLPNNESTNPKQTISANVQFFFPENGTYYLKVRDIAGNIAQLPVNISLLDISTLNITVTGEFIYDGTPKEATVAIVDTARSKTLRINEDFRLEFDNNINAGNNTANVKIIGIGDYAGETTKHFSIGKRDLVVTPDKGQEKLAGVEDPVFSFTSANYITGEVPVFSGKLSREAGEGEGEYAFLVGTLALSSSGRFLDSNYNLVFNNPYSYTPEAQPVPTVRPDKDELIKFKISNFDGMTTTWKTTSANTVISLPIPSNVNNNYTVSWGDGTYDRYTIENFPTHTYATAKEYTVRIVGKVKSFGYYGDVQPTQDNLYKDYVSFNSYLTGIISYGKLGLQRIGFSYCTKLEKPLPPITGFESVTSIENMFNGCVKITAIPTGYFKDLPGITSARQVFMGCTGIVGPLEDTLFANDNAIKSFEGAFAKCTNLEGAIPTNMFATNIACESFARTFMNDSKLTGALDENLFANNKRTQNFASTFQSCTGITSIPEYLFKNNNVAINFYRTFYGDTGLTTVPENLFIFNAINKISNSTTGTADYCQTFMGCTNIEGILKLNSTLIGRGMFEGCTNYVTLNLPNCAELGNRAFYGNNTLKNIYISKDNFSEIGTNVFYFSGTPAPKLTFINRNNEILLNYAWASDNRKLDNEPPKGTVEIVSPTYPFTNTENVTLHITCIDAESSANDCRIAILNDVDYDSFIKDNESLLEQYQRAKILEGDEEAEKIEQLFSFEWIPYEDNKAWTIPTGDGIKTVYVYFMDEAGNISNVSTDF